MARAKSVVLTPAEKKAAITDLRTRIKADEVALKAINARKTVADKEFAAANKAIAKATSDALKAHTVAVKTVSKDAALVNKSLDSLKAQLAICLTPVASAADVAQAAIKKAAKEPATA